MAALGDTICELEACPCWLMKDSLERPGPRLTGVINTLFREGRMSDGFSFAVVQKAKPSLNVGSPSLPSAAPGEVSVAGLYHLDCRWWIKCLSSPAHENKKETFLCI